MHNTSKDASSNKVHPEIGPDSVDTNGADARKAWSPTRMQIIFGCMMLYVIMDTAFHVSTIGGTDETLQVAHAHRHVEWLIKFGCDGDHGFSCDEICNGTCDAASLATLVSEANFQNALSRRGLRCNEYSVFRSWFYKKFDGPWLHSEVDKVSGKKQLKCGYVSGRYWTPNCSLRTSCGYHRICPCALHPGALAQMKTTTTTTIGFPAEDCHALNRLDITWTLATRASCGESCKSMGHTCSPAAMHSLTEAHLVQEAVTLAGGMCKKYKKRREALVNSTMPFIKKGQCNYFPEHVAWTPSCEARTQNTQDVRICACKIAEEWSPAMCRNELDFQKTMLTWVVGSAASAPEFFSCDNVCAGKDASCDLKALNNLARLGPIKSVSLLAGVKCTTFVKLLIPDYHGPWKSEEDGVCGYYNEERRWKFSCSMENPGSKTRICPCRSRHPDAPTLTTTPKPTLTENDCDMLDRLDIKWFVARDKRSASLEPKSCTQVCVEHGHTCFSRAMWELTREDRVAYAFTRAGESCRTYERFTGLPEPGAWDGPWINHYRQCGYAWAPNGATPEEWAPNCEKTIGDGHGRICACITGEAWQPSLCLQQKTTYTTTTTTFHDANLGALQKYYYNFLPKRWKRWFNNQRQVHAAELDQYYERLYDQSKPAVPEPEYGLHWIVGKNCGGALSYASCDVICGRVNSTCVASELSSLQQKQAVRIAAEAAGTPCNRTEKFKDVVGEWDGPWLSDERVCGFTTSRQWRPNCHKSTLEGFARICPCKGNAVRYFEPETCVEAMSWWHGHWLQECDRNANVPVPGPISRHFHFVELGERSNFIDRKLPISPVTRGAVYDLFNQEAQFLLDNMAHTLILNNATSVHLHDELSCRIAIRKFSPLLEVQFDREVDIRFKSDMCRSAALYFEGGIYNDDDQINYIPVTPWLKKSTNFASAQTDHDLRSFANSFMAATPCHPAVKRQLELMISANTAFDPNGKVMDPDGLIGPRTLAETFARHYYNVWFSVDGKLAEASEKNGTQLLREIELVKLTQQPSPPKTHGHSCDFGFYDPESRRIFACSRP